MNILFFESVSILLVAVYLVAHTIDATRQVYFLWRFGMMALAAWSLEESCIRLYGFYLYTPDWTLFLGHVPVLVIIIWPVIIHSGWCIASQMLRQDSLRVSLAAAFIVMTDALLIEPLAVNAGLWVWNQPGIYGVPPIGIFGWAFFAFFCAFLLDREEKSNKKNLNIVLFFLLPVVGTHTLLLTAWWGALRWTTVTPNPWLLTDIAIALSLFMVYFFLRNRRGVFLEKKTMIMRFPAALLIFSLLTVNVPDSTALVLYAISFIPPYIILTVQGFKIWPTFRTSQNNRTFNQFVKPFF